jgi:uncharacterized protein (DUF58 family)
MASARLLDRSLESSRLVSLVLRLYRERLTSRGRYVLWLGLLLGFIHVDARQSPGYLLFAIAAGPFLVASLLMVRRRPRVLPHTLLPERLTAGRRVTVGLETPPVAKPTGAMVAGWGWARARNSGLQLEPPEAFFEGGPGHSGEALLGVRASRRGRYELPPLGVGRTDPLGLLSTRRVWVQGRVILAYPRFFHLEELPLPVGRRYQPGGIPLASNLGDSTEFVGTREYREGDPLRHIHWRSWARRGKPVVKEYNEEYFSRVALILDTYLPRRPRRAEREAFESAISVLASIADHMSRSEEVVDVFAAGPDLYEMSTGRSLGYLDNVLDVLACLEPCHEPPFDVLAPRLVERLARLTTVIAVVLDWDEGREAFLRRIRALGVAVRIILVRERPTRRRFEGLEDQIGPITQMTPTEVEERIVADAGANEGPP